MNTLDPFNFKEQEEAFTASALQAAAFLQRGFVDSRQQQSRDFDPIVGVSFTGAFTFFVKAFGSGWLKWWEAGRPDEWDCQDMGVSGWGEVVKIADELLEWNKASDFIKDGVCCDGLLYKKLEESFLTRWKEIVHNTVWHYCDRHGLKRPNRCTTLKPEGSMTLLTGVGCNGHHPPKSWRYIRRMTFGKDDPIALAALDYGYSVVPSQSDKDENGRLLDDPFDPRCTEWLIEVPVEEEIVHLFPDAAEVDPSQFSALAQFDWAMQVQNYYVTHNVSQTLEFRQNEIPELSERIYRAIQNDEGYISAALLARFDANETFPRLPFEPISKERYEELTAQVLQRRKSDDFQSLIGKYMAGHQDQGPQDSACDGGACELRVSKPV